MNSIIKNLKNIILGRWYNEKFKIDVTIEEKRYPFYFVNYYSTIFPELKSKKEETFEILLGDSKSKSISISSSVGIWQLNILSNQKIELLSYDIKEKATKSCIFNKKIDNKTTPIG